MSERVLLLGKYLVRTTLAYFGVVFALMLMPSIFAGSTVADTDINKKPSSEAALAVGLAREIENYLPTDRATMKVTTDNRGGYRTTVNTDGAEIDLKNIVAETAERNGVPKAEGLFDWIFGKSANDDNGITNLSVAELAKSTGSQKIVLTTIANYARPTKTIHDITYMQEMTAEVCAATETPLAEEDGALITEVPEATLIDSRDGKSYLVRKLADGHCWMAQNLALDLSTEKTLTSDDTDISKHYNDERQEAAIRNVKNGDDYLVKIADALDEKKEQVVGLTNDVAPITTDAETLAATEETAANPIDISTQIANDDIAAANAAGIDTTNWQIDPTTGQIIDVTTGQIVDTTMLVDPADTAKTQALADAIKDLEEAARARAEAARAAAEAEKAAEHDKAAEIERTANKLSNKSAKDVAKMLKIELPTYTGFTPDNDTQTSAGERWGSSTGDQEETDVARSQIAVDPANGNYYNWYAATAGTGTYYMEDKSAGSSICPKGWELPNGSGVKSFTNLIKLYGFTGGTQDISQKDYLTSAPLSLSLAGAYYYNGLLGGEGEWGDYWTKEAANLVAANFDVEKAAQNYNQKTNGFSIRCVEK